MEMDSAKSGPIGDDSAALPYQRLHHNSLGFKGLGSHHAKSGERLGTFSPLEDGHMDFLVKDLDPASALSSSSRLSSVHCGCEGVGVVDVVDVGRWGSVLCVICLITHLL